MLYIQYMQLRVKGLWKISSFNDKTDCARSFQSTHSLFSSGSFLLAFYVIFLGKCQRYQGQKHQHSSYDEQGMGRQILRKSIGIYELSAAHDNRIGDHRCNDHRD